MRLAAELTALLKGLDQPRVHAADLSKALSPN